MRPRPIPIGKRYGRLVVMGPAPMKGKNVRWECRCDCGKSKNCRPEHLNAGVSQSCGCLRAEVSRARMTTHGRAETPLFRVWSTMLQRCSNPNHNRYQVYGGRGISVCARWRNSFANFLADMGERPSPHHSIDRIDNDKGYSPKNCRWATAAEQQANTQRSIAKRAREAAERLNVDSYDYQHLKNQLAAKRKLWRRDEPMFNRLNILTEQVKNLDQYQRDGDEEGIAGITRCMKVTMREIAEIEAAT